jgi:hypothetical protein
MYAHTDGNGLNEVSLYVIDLLLLRTRCGILTLYVYDILLQYLLIYLSVQFSIMGIMCCHHDFSVVFQVCPFFISFYIKFGEMK